MHYYALLCMINRFILEALTEVLAPELLAPSDVADRSSEPSSDLSSEHVAPTKKNVRYKTKDASTSSSSNSSSGSSESVYWPECTRAALLDFIAKYIELSLVQVSTAITTAKVGCNLAVLVADCSQQL
jgi:hypothetical protein